MIAVDWDDTLVDARSQEWLPGAVVALRTFRNGGGVFVHSCRASWPGGLDQIRLKLRSAGFGDVRVVPKPQADRYVDNLGWHFPGSWAAVDLKELV